MKCIQIIHLALPGIILPVHQAWVIQKVDKAIHQIIQYPVDSVVCFVSIYPLGRDLSCLMYGFLGEN